MSYFCEKCKTGGHESVEHARNCFFPPAKSVTYPPLGLATERQRKYLVDLGFIAPVHMTKAEASKKISELLAAKKGKPAQLTAAPPAKSLDDQQREFEARQQAREAAKAAEKQKLALIEGLIDMVPEGYYAAQPEGQPLKFVYFSRPTKGLHKDSLKFSEQIGAIGKGRYEIRAERWGQGWRKGQWDLDYRAKWIVEAIMLVVADHQSAATLYAAETEHCCRCNATLTDERSRWYGIGPECEQYPSHAWVISMVDDSTKGPYRAGATV